MWKKLLNAFRARELESVVLRRVMAEIQIARAVHY